MDCIDYKKDQFFAFERSYPCKSVQLFFTVHRHEPILLKIISKLPGTIVHSTRLSRQNKKAGNRKTEDEEIYEVKGQGQ